VYDETTRRRVHETAQDSLSSNWLCATCLAASKAHERRESLELLHQRAGLWKNGVVAKLWFCASGVATTVVAKEISLQYADDVTSSRPIQDELARGLFRGGNLLS